MNKKLIAGIGALALILNAAQATSYTFVPSDPDLDDLDHRYAYTWRIDAPALLADLNGGMVIKSAQLKIYNIYDWQVTEWDRLWVHLLDTAGFNQSGNWLRVTYDNEAPTDYFGASGPQIPVDAAFDHLIGSPDNASNSDGWYQDPDGILTKETITFTFDSALLATLTGYVKNTSPGVFGIGFDPDCHYYNDKIELTVVVPDGGMTLTLLGLGLTGLAALRRSSR